MGIAVPIYASHMLNLQTVVLMFAGMLLFILLLLHVQNLGGLLDMIQSNSPYCCHQHAIHTLQCCFQDCGPRLLACICLTPSAFLQIARLKDQAAALETQCQAEFAKKQNKSNSAAKTN